MIMCAVDWVINQDCFVSKISNYLCFVGFKTLALFNGKASVYVHTTLIKKWDICSGSAILRQAGGKMTTLKGEDIDFSYSSNPKNKGGLLAARTQHDVYLEKLGPVL